MKKFCGNLKVVIGLCIILSIVFSMKQFVYAASITDSRTNISPDKIWTISFNSNVDSDFVNENYISMETSNGKAVDVKLNVEPTNPKKVDVSLKSGTYSLGQTYVLTVKQGFSDENGHVLKQDRVMQFTIKNQLVDTADFKVQVYNNMGIVIVSLNSISDSSNIIKYKVEGQDDKDDAVDVNNGEAYIMSNKLQNLNVYFYDASGKLVGNSLINVQQACSSQVVTIGN